MSLSAPSVDTRRAARAFDSLLDAADRLRADAPGPRLLRPADERGYFRPDEENTLLSWFGRFLTVREGLWQLISEGATRLEQDPERIVSDDDRRIFVLTYGAACILVTLDRLLVDRVAIRSSVQRKLNEGDAARRIPRKQFTAVLESLSDPRGALLIRAAMDWRRAHRQELEALRDCETVGRAVAELPRLERALDPSARRFLRIVGRYLSHAFRRQGASARQQVFFHAIEAGGRLAADLRAQLHEPRVGSNARTELEALLRPGDVLVLRHDHALTNLFLPGYWPHAALYVGALSDAEELGVLTDPDRRQRWGDRCRVLEALKDGVGFRPLSTTLAVDAVAVIRPRLPPEDIAAAISRAIEHEGKGYNFDFDFFRTDRLVCTEVVYRGYDGVGGLEIPLRERSGRPTLSAEDLLDLALASRGFEPVAVYGAPPFGDQLITGPSAAGALVASYRAGARRPRSGVRPLP